NCNDVNPVTSRPPQHPLPKSAGVSRMVLTPSVQAAPWRAVPLVSVIARAPPELASVPVPAPKFLNQSDVVAGQVYRTSGVCALTLEISKPRTASEKKPVNHRSDFIRAPPPLSFSTS